MARKQLGLTYEVTGNIMKINLPLINNISYTHIY